MQTIDTIEYCYSFDEEIYHGRFSSSEEALAEARDACGASGNVSVWIGQCKEVSLTSMVDADYVIERLQEEASERVGESSEDWLHVDAEPKQELERLILDWVMRHDPPRFYEVGDTTHHVLDMGDEE